MTKSPMDAAMDAWLELHPGQAATADVVSLMRAVVLAVQPVVRRRAFTDAAIELRTRAKEVSAIDRPRSVGITDAADLCAGWAARGVASC